MMFRVISRGAIAALVATTTMSGAANASAAAVKEWPVAIRDLGRAQAAPGYHVFRTEDAWRKAAGQSGGVTGNRPALPRVNWWNEMVLAVSMGQKPTAGYDVRITSVKRVGEEIIVSVRETEPPADAIVAQVLTYPSHAVAVRRLAGPVVFVVNGERQDTGSGSVRKIISRRPGYGVPAVSGSTGTATSLFVVRESGGIAGIDRQTVVHLVGRPVRSGEVSSVARVSRAAQIPGPLLRLVEKSVRDSGFMALNGRYAAERPVADGMTRTIQAQVDGKVKVVSVEDGAAVPEAFEAVWQSIQTAVNSKGSIVQAWREAK